MIRSVSHKFGLFQNLLEPSGPQQASELGAERNLKPWSLHTLTFYRLRLLHYSTSQWKVPTLQPMSKAIASAIFEFSWCFKNVVNGLALWIQIIPPMAIFLDFPFSRIIKVQLQQPQRWKWAHAYGTYWCRTWINPGTRFSTNWNMCFCLTHF